MNRHYLFYSPVKIVSLSALLALLLIFWPQMSRADIASHSCSSGQIAAEIAPSSKEGWVGASYLGDNNKIVDLPPIQIDSERSSYSWSPSSQPSKYRISTWENVEKSLFGGVSAMVNRVSDTQWILC